MHFDIRYNVKTHFFSCKESLTHPLHISTMLSSSNITKHKNILFEQSRFTNIQMMPCVSTEPVQMHLSFTRYTKKI